MDNVSALSLPTIVPQGREGQGIWEQGEGFVDLMQTLMSQGDSPPAPVATVRNTTPYAGSLFTSGFAINQNTNCEDMDVDTVVFPPVANGQEDLLQLIALLTGEEDNGDFLCALEQYIKENPNLLNSLKALDFTGEEALDKLEQCLAELIPDEEELPPGLMPLLALLSPPVQVIPVTADTPDTAVDGIAAAQPVENAEQTAPEALRATDDKDGGQPPVSAEYEPPQVTGDAQVSGSEQPEPAAQTEQAIVPEQTSQAETAAQTVRAEQPAELPQQHQEEQTVQAAQAGQPAQTVQAEELQTASAQTVEPVEAEISRNSEITSRKTERKRETHVPRSTYENVRQTMRAARAVNTTRWAAIQSAVASEYTAPEATETPEEPIPFKTAVSPEVFDSISTREPAAPPEASETADIPENNEPPKTPQISETAEQPQKTQETQSGSPDTVEEKREVTQKTAEPAVRQQEGIPVQSNSPPAAQQTEAQSAKHVLADKLIEQIVQQTAQSNNSTVLQMELHPKLLGKVQLVLEANGDGMTVRLKSDNGAVRSLLNENIAELKDALREAGINMKDIEVSESRIGTNLAQSREKRETAEEGKKQVFRIQSFAPSRETEAVQPAFYETGRVAAGGESSSQFDYRA